jgi:hypothetical protein
LPTKEDWDNFKNHGWKRMREAMDMPEGESPDKVLRWIVKDMEFVDTRIKDTDPIKGYYRKDIWDGRELRIAQEKTCTNSVWPTTIDYQIVKPTILYKNSQKITKRKRQ